MKVRLLKKIQGYQQGAALIMALLIISIVAAIATTLMYSQQLDIQRTILKENADQAYLQALYVPEWARYTLNQLSIAKQQQHKLPVWPVVMPEKKLTLGATIKADIQPANGRFNINDLAQPVSQYLVFFQQLIQAVDPDVDAKHAQTISKNVQQWLLPLTSGTTDDPAYGRMSPPYQVAHRQMSSISELRLVDGISGGLYQKLLPYVIALPNTNLKINLNNAQRPLFLALLGLNDGAADAALAFRKENGGFQNTSQFLSLPAVMPYNQTKNKNKSWLGQVITTDFPSYFLVQTQIKRDTMQFDFMTILMFTSKQQQLSIVQQGQSL
jgi:general secretion pathway protein K